MPPRQPKSRKYDGAVAAYKHATSLSAEACQKKMKIKSHQNDDKRYTQPSVAIAKSPNKTRRVVSAEPVKIKTA